MEIASECFDVDSVVCWFNCVAWKIEAEENVNNGGRSHDEVAVEDAKWTTYDGRRSAPTSSH